MAFSNERNVYYDEALRSIGEDQIRNDLQTIQDEFFSMLTEQNGEKAKIIVGRPTQHRNKAFVEIHFRWLGKGNIQRNVEAIMQKEQSFAILVHAWQDVKREDGSEVRYFNWRDVGELTLPFDRERLHDLLGMALVGVSLLRQEDLYPHKLGKSGFSK